MAVPWWSLLLAVLVGTWAAHSLEYVRVWGPGRFSSMAARSVHTYVGWAGLALLSLASFGVAGTFWSYHRLHRLLIRIARGDRTALVEYTSHHGGRPFRLRAHIGWLVPALVLLQGGVYFAQENLETHVARLPMPGLGVFIGIHAWAPAVHLFVVSAVAAVLWLLHWPGARLAERVAEAAAALSAARAVPVSWRLPTAARTWTPAQRWGLRCWSRPPPIAA